MATQIPSLATDTTSSEQVKTLSARVKTLCWLALPAALVALMAVSPLAAALLPILALPTVWLFWKWKASDSGKTAELGTMVWLYFGTGTAGTFAVVVIESVLSYGFAILLFQFQTQTYLDEWSRQETDRRNHIDAYGTEHEDARKRMTARWQYLLFLVLTSYVAIAMVEEGLKYCSLLIVRRYRAVVHESDYITYAMTSALGFGTLENLTFIYQASQVESGGQLALSVFERVALGAPGHAMTSCLLAINVVRRDLRGEPMNLWHVMRLPVLLHGTFDFVLFYISAANGNIGWVHPRDGISLMLVLTFAMGMSLATWVILRHQIRKYSIRLDS